jgi:hypothetical protein
LTAPLAA